MLRFASATSSRSVQPSLFHGPHLFNAQRAFVIPRQLKAYGDTFIGTRKEVRSSYLVPHNELTSLKAASHDGRHMPSTTVAVAENVDSFDDMHLPKQVTEALAELGVRVPSPVQQQAIPAILQASSSGDEFGGARGAVHSGTMILASPHGSGKTYAYLAPLFARLMKDRDVYSIPLRENRPRAIIFAPTRELIWQISHACQAFERHTGLKSLAFTSTKRNNRKWRLMMKKTMPDILIMGPSMALRAIENHRLFLDDLRSVVLDEADELVSATSSRLGQRFLSKVIRRLCYRHLWPVNTQTLFVTSGLTRELAGYIKAKHGQAVPAVMAAGIHCPVKTSRHRFIPVSTDRLKLDVLRRVLLRAGFKPDGDEWSNSSNYNGGAAAVQVDEREEKLLKKLQNSASRNGNADQMKQLVPMPTSDSAVLSISQKEQQGELPRQQFEQSEEAKDELQDYDFFDFFMRNGKHPKHRRAGSTSADDSVIRWEHQETRPAPFINPHANHKNRSTFGENGSRSNSSNSNNNNNNKTIIFFKNIDRCTALFHKLKALGFNVGIVHASLPGEVRDANYRKWASGETPVLCATDLCSRGIDVDVSCVINFDMPTDAKPYLNRAGRTARMGRPGAVVSLFTKKQQVIVDALKQFLKHNLPLEGVHNYFAHMQKPNYTQFRHLRRTKLAKKFVSLITRKTIPAHLEKVYIRHNAMWRPLFRPRGVEDHAGVPVRQQKKITAKIEHHAMWYRRILLAHTKKGSAKFGRRGKDGSHLRTGHSSQGGIETMGAADPQELLNKHSDKYLAGSYAGPPTGPPK